nr:hypothetical protein [uncultured Cupriavidus sp.]
MSLLNIIKQATAILSGARSKSDPKVAVSVGTGAENEFEILINGIPNLFRDEGSCVVHFVAQFDRCIQHTEFGNKLLPEVIPRWSKVQTYDQAGVTPQSVAEAVMRESKQESAGAKRKDSKPDRDAVDIESTGRAMSEPRHHVPKAEASSSSYTVGKLVEWGEMEFPNRKPGGKPTYTSFAVKLDTSNGVKTLQGEGLKDVLADAHCKVGERVGIKRLYKEKVPAFDHATGRPIFERGTQKQKLWDRWVWSINRIH